MHQLRTIACLIPFIPLQALAFNPLAVIAIAQTTAEIISTVSDTTSELSGAADAFGDLYSEIDNGSEVSPDGRATISKIREVETLAREAGYTKEEVDDLLGTDRTELQSLASTLRRMTQAIRAGKRIVHLVSKLEAKAHVSQLEIHCH